MNLSQYSFLAEYLKKAIKWIAVSRGMKAKAEKYLKESKIEYVRVSEDPYNKLVSYEFVWSPIKGYNKTKRVVTVTLRYKQYYFPKPYREYELRYLGCNCDGFRKNGICSHILALYYLLRYAKK